MNSTQDQAADFRTVLFEADTLVSVPFDAVRDTVASHALACVRGLFDPHEVRDALERIHIRFDPANDRKHDPRDCNAVRRNFQKLQIGANSGIDSRRTLGRFMRALYNPIFAADIYGMREHFVKLAHFRNLLYGVPVEFAVHGTEQGYWTCSRILQYPRGGGFMVPHRDFFSQAATIETGMGYFQTMLVLTERSRDFDEGGAYVDRGEQRFQYEPFCRTGDVIVYDGNSIHGVADIDPMQDLDLRSFSGRAVAVVSLFRHLDGTDDYAALSARAAETISLDT